MSVLIAGFDSAAEVPALPGLPARMLRAVLPGRFESVLFIDLGSDPGTDDGAVADAEAEVRAVAGAAAGRYELVHEGSTAAPALDPEADPAESVWFVNCFACPVGGEDAAFEFWAHVNEYMVTRPGYRGHRLHRRVGDSAAPFGLVNLVEWESVAAWKAAHDAGFRARAIREDMPFRPFPTLCTAQPVAVGS